MRILEVVVSLSFLFSCNTVNHKKYHMLYYSIALLYRNPVYFSKNVNQSIGFSDLSVMLGRYRARNIS